MKDQLDKIESKLDRILDKQDDYQKRLSKVEVKTDGQVIAEYGVSRANTGYPINITYSLI